MINVCYSPKTKQGDMPVRNILQVMPFTRGFVPTKMGVNRPSWFRAVSGNSDGNMTQCPSFINMMNVGYVVKSMTDIYVSEKDGEIKLESDYHNIASSVSDKFSFANDIEVHTHNQFCDDFPFEEGFVPISLKFSSPFVFMPEETLDVIFMPCWWDDAYKYIRAYHGVVRHSKKEPIGYEINTAVKIPSDKPYCIKAGTPLAQIIPCNIKQVNFNLIDKPSAYRKIMQPSLGTRLSRYVSTRSESSIKRIKSFLVLGGNK